MPTAKERRDWLLYPPHLRAMLIEADPWLAILEPPTPSQEYKELVESELERARVRKLKAKAKAESQNQMDLRNWAVLWNIVFFSAVTLYFVLA